MAPFNAFGSNGIHAGFYQHMWETVGDSIVFCFVVNFLDKGILPEGVNDTSLVLIPKVPNLEQLSHLHPISLCNMTYKTITKSMANMLKEIMPKGLAPNQSSFVSDN